MIKCSRIAYPESISMEEYLERFFEITEESTESIEYEENGEEEACSLEQASFFIYLFINQSDCVKKNG